jgi:tetratricopeptide (TPR) repeat protein
MPEHRRLRVVQVESPSKGRQGDSVYRTLQPSDALGHLGGVEVLSGTLLSPRVHAAWWTADVVVLCDVVDADCLPLLHARRQRGLATIYEINDDFRAPQPWSATAYLAHNLLSRSLSPQLAHLSHGLQFATLELQRRYGGLNPRQAVLPNQLAEPPPPPPASRELTIGWGGSWGHLEDVRAILPTLRRVLAAREGVHLSLMGDRAFAAFGAGLPEGRFAFTPAGGLSAYYDFVRGLTIGLAPNLDTDFNRCRSDVKYLEYAAHGVVPVVADLPPYEASVQTGVNGVRYRSAAELESWLLRLIDEPELRRAIAARAWEDVHERRLEAVHAPTRLAWLEAVIHAAGAPPPDFHALPPGGHLHDEASAADDWLYEGLVLARDGRDERAAQAHRKAVSARPGFHVGHLYLGQSTPDDREAERELDLALDLEPRSVSAAYLLGERALSRGDGTGAQRAFERAHRIAPTLGAPAFQLGLISTAQGDALRAAQWFTLASAENPFFGAPPLQSALAALDAGRPGDAELALERFERDDPNLWLTQFVLGRAALLTHRYADARRRFERALEHAVDPVPVLAHLARACLGSGDERRARLALEQIHEHQRLHQRAA